MNTPPAGGTDRAPRKRSPGSSPSNPRAAVGHALCAAIGFVATVAFAVLFYSELVAAIEGLQPELLTTTALVFVLVWVWAGIWTAAEAAWEWRSRRTRLER
ncbi:hypothetical protein [Halobaculum magnesiiphilum]|uniref:Uncharacterized protein n=1 Tax=Halobaculum magnesiiphilum TaxID=1017351 RepID=A0A8T8WHU9_9EURY|nr:hypothetical protein [Halobaculum magnesiiphilum]QZP39431.1 hypothetical protein K6T50_17750 [Halobaculum magnesiiphilum]